MKKAQVYQQGQLAGLLEELEGGRYRFSYAVGYAGEPVSLAMPISKAIHEFADFPPVFEGLLPEGVQLEAFLRREKIDRNDPFSQLIAVGADMVGALTVREVK